MGNRVEVDDTGEEYAVLVGRRGPISDLSQDLYIIYLRIIEARSVDQGDFSPRILKRVSLDLAGAFLLSALESNFYSRELSYKNKNDR